MADSVTTTAAVTAALAAWERDEPTPCAQCGRVALGYLQADDETLLCRECTMAQPPSPPPLGVHLCDECFRETPLPGDGDQPGERGLCPECGAMEAHLRGCNTCVMTDVQWTPRCSVGRALAEPIFARDKANCTAVPRERVEQ